MVVRERVALVDATDLTAFAAFNRFLSVLSRLIEVIVIHILRSGINASASNKKRVPIRSLIDCLNSTLVQYFC